MNNIYRYGDNVAKFYLKDRIEADEFYCKQCRKTFSDSDELVTVDRDLVDRDNIIYVGICVKCDKKLEKNPKSKPEGGYGHAINIKLTPSS